MPHIIVPQIDKCQAYMKYFGVRPKNLSSVLHPWLQSLHVTKNFTLYNVMQKHYSRMNLIWIKASSMVLKVDAQNGYMRLI